MYVLVEFTDEKNLAVIPDIWRDGTMCALWPNFKSSSRITTAVIKKLKPEDDWKSFPIRILYKDESYQKVRQKISQAEVESDIATALEERDDETDIPVARRSKRKIRKTVLTSSDEEDEVNKSKPTAPVKTVEGSLSQKSDKVTGSP